MSKSKKTETIYSNSVVHALEQQYCSSCSAAVISPCLVSSQSFGERVVSRIYNGGRQIVYTATVGAMLVNNLAVPAYANQIVGPGQVLENYTATGEQVNVKSRGKTVNLTLNSDGREYVSAGGSAHITTINSGGYQQLRYADATSTTVNAGGQQRLEYSEATTTILNGGLQTLYHNGTVARDTVINSGGIQQAYQNTSAISTIIYSGGLQDIREYVEVMDTRISDGGKQYLSNGVATSTVIDNGGKQYVFGGSAISTTINSGGNQHIQGGVVSATFIIDGGNQYLSGGTATDTIITYGANQYVSSSVANNTTVYDGGSQHIFAGGVASHTIVSSGGKQYIFSGAAAYDTTLNSGGSQHISFGGGATNVVINSGGSQHIFSGGVATNTTLNSGGNQHIASDAIAFATVINAGGSQHISVGGSAYDTVVNSGGIQQVSAGGDVNGTIINTGGGQNISSGAIVNNTTVNAGGWQNISSGAIVNNTTINTDGWQNVSSGGMANSATINARGTQDVYSTAVVNNTTINGGYQAVRSGATASGTTINTGSQHVLGGGVANSTLIHDTGLQYVEAGGVVSNTTVNGGGSQYISAGAKAYDTVQNSGGNILADVVGGDTSTYVSGTNQNGETMLLENGVASNFIINVGGYQKVYEGGVTSNTTIEDGYQLLTSGATANNTTLHGGRQIVMSGATAMNTFMDGGSLEVSPNAVVSNVTALGGAIDMYGDNTLRGNLSLTAMDVNIHHSTVMNTLAVEHLTANHVVFNMNVDLEQQTADKLNITSSYSGSAYLKLENVSEAQKTTGNGIKLVEFGSGASIDGTVDLLGGKWDEGAYEYKLAQMGDSPDYYLQSTGDLSDAFKTMINVPIMNATIAQTGMNSLQKRLGDLRAMNNPNAKQGVWVRSYYKDMTVKDLIKTDMNLFGAEAGYDWLFRAEEPTKLYAGVLVGFVAASNIKTKNDNGSYDKGDSETPGIGVYATLLNESGWFVDIAARNFWSKLNMKNYASDGTELSYKPQQNIFTTSVEVGKSLNRELARNRFVRIEPKVEMAYINTAADKTSVSNTGSQVKYDAANYINAKAGVLLSYNAVRENGLLIEPLLELAYRYEFNGKNQVTYDGVKKEVDMKGGAVEINAGLNMELTKNLYWYGLMNYEAGRKEKGWGVHAGIRYAFGKEKTE